MQVFLLYYCYLHVISSIKYIYLFIYSQAEIYLYLSILLLYNPNKVFKKLPQLFTLE